MAAARILAGGRLRSATAVVGLRLTPFAPHVGRRCPLAPPALDAPTAPGLLAPRVPALPRRAPEHDARSANLVPFSTGGVHYDGEKLRKAGVGGRRRAEEKAKVADGDVAAGGRTEKAVKLVPFSTGGAQSEGEKLRKAGASGVAGLGSKAEEEAGVGVGKTKVADGKVDATGSGLAGSDAGHTGPGFGKEFCRFDDGLRSQMANVETNTRVFLIDLFQEYSKDRDEKARKEANRQILFTLVIALVIEIGFSVLNKQKNTTGEKENTGDKERKASGGAEKAKVVNDSNTKIVEVGGKGCGGEEVIKVKGGGQEVPKGSGGEKTLKSGGKKLLKPKSGKGGAGGKATKGGSGAKESAKGGSGSGAKESAKSDSGTGAEVAAKESA